MEPLLNRLRGRRNEPIHSIFNSIPKPVDKVKNGYDYIIRGEVEQHLIKCHHPAIIDRKTYESAQMLRKHRKSGNNPKFFRPFSGRLICHGCGRFFHLYNLKPSPLWHCPSSGSESVNPCNPKQIYEYELNIVLRKAFCIRFSNTDNPILQLTGKMEYLENHDYTEKEQHICKMMISAMDKELAILRECNHITGSDITSLNRLIDTRKQSDEELNKIGRIVELRECDRSEREEAIKWMNGLPEGMDGIHQLINGICGKYVRAFISAIIILEPRKFKVRWFDDEETKITTD